MIGCTEVPYFTPF